MGHSSSSKLGGGVPTSRLGKNGWLADCWTKCSITPAADLPSSHETEGFSHPLTWAQDSQGDVGGGVNIKKHLEPPFSIV